MKFFKNIRLTAYEVEYIDLEHTAHRETLVLDSDIKDALSCVGLPSVDDYIEYKFKQLDCDVVQIKQGNTIDTHVDLSELWSEITGGMKSNQRSNGADGRL